MTSPQNYEPYRVVVFSRESDAIMLDDQEFENYDEAMEDFESTVEYYKSNHETEPFVSRVIQIRNINNAVMIEREFFSD